MLIEIFSVRWHILYYPVAALAVRIRKGVEAFIVSQEHTSRFEFRIYQILKLPYQS